MILKHGGTQDDSASNGVVFFTLMAIALTCATRTKAETVIINGRYGLCQPPPNLFVGTACGVSADAAANAIAAGLTFQQVFALQTDALNVVEKCLNQAEAACPEPKIFTVPVVDLFPGNGTFVAVQDPSLNAGGCAPGIEYQVYYDPGVITARWDCDDSPYEPEPEPEPTPIPQPPSFPIMP